MKFQTISTILKGAAIPALMVIALLSSLAGRYEGLLNFTICLSAVVLSIQRAAWRKDYGWAAVSIVVFVVFSPLLLVTKIFLLMGLTCAAACLAVVASFRPQPVAAL
jgi:hypothetical protein